MARNGRRTTNVRAGDGVDESSGIDMSMKTGFVKSVFLLGIFFAAGIQSLSAEEQGDVHPYLTEKFHLDTGVYFPERKVRLSVDGLISGPNDPVDFQTEFGLRKSDETFSLDFGWRFGEKWGLGGQYFEASGAKSAVLSEDIEWNDVIFGQGTGIVVSQEFRLIRVFFGRNFESSDRYNFGAGAGLHLIELGAFIEGSVIIGGGGTAFATESVSASVPLPNIGIWYMYSISSSWALRSRLDWLSVEFGDYDGQLINASLGVNYQMFEHFGVGLNYNLFELDVTVSKSDWRGRLETSYEGIYAYLSFYW